MLSVCIQFARLIRIMHIPHVYGVTYTNKCVLCTYGHNSCVWDDCLLGWILAFWYLHDIMSTRAWGFGF